MPFLHSCFLSPRRLVLPPKSPCRASAHQIAGASGSIGFDRIGELAAVLERKLVEFEVGAKPASKAQLGEVALLCADYTRPGTRNPSIRGSTTSTSGRSFPPEQRQVNPRSPRSGRGSEGTFALKFPVPISACLPILIKPPGKPSVRTRVESEGCALDLCCRRSTLRGSVRGSG